MNAFAVIGLDNVRYRQMGTDPIAKRLYAVAFDALKTYQEATELLEEYLDRRDAAIASGSQRP